MCGGWFASVANFKDDVIPLPNLTRLVVKNLLRTSLSRYLSRALSPRSLYFSVFFCLSKQTDASVLMMSCFRPQASMADAWHSHAIHHCPLYTPQTTHSFSSTCMLQTNSCRLFNMRVCALLLFRWRTLQTFACASLNRKQGNLAQAGRCLFGPVVGCLPSARHCSQVCGFLKSNLPFDVFGRNCVRGKLRAHAWHVIGLAAASMDSCLFLPE